MQTKGGTTLMLNINEGRIVSKSFFPFLGSLVLALTHYVCAASTTIPTGARERREKGL